MIETRVTYHHEDDAWWAESPDVPGFSAAADSLPDLRQVVREGLSFHIGTAGGDLRESMADDSAVFVAEVTSTSGMSSSLWMTTSGATQGYRPKITSAATTTPFLNRLAS